MSEDELVRQHVNKVPNGASEADEVAVLESLGYRLSADGAYEGGDPDGDE